MSFDDATLRQITAARPDRSTWLTANAGSGKTRVLTDRVARLLLDGVDPQNILCLTYTKAAAGEMQNRLFQTLGAWAMLSDADLSAQLRAKGIEGAPDLAQARRLFARAIETPGGLKIQTIHSFCSGLLRRFPMEARVSPQFTEMDDRTGELLRLEVLDDLAQSDGADGDALRRFAAVYTGGAVESFGAELMSHADHFMHGFPAPDIADAVGADANASLDDMLSAAFGDLGDMLTALVSALRTGGANDAKAADKLAPFMANPVPDMALFRTLANVFLTGGGAKSPFAAKIGSFPTKAVQANHSDLMDDLNPVMEQVEQMRQPVLAQLAFERTRVLYEFGTVFVPMVRARMQARGLLGFDDLIARARDLLTTPEVAAWVLWRLDGGIDHILVDEAQDTSPDQWAVIRLLAQEFAAGQGANTDRLRTLFVVGDRKQSIYSFQGADPREFDRMNAHFDAMLGNSDTPLVTTSLDHSFRSSKVILDLVDRVCNADGVEGLEHHVTHLAFRDTLPGRVDMWPPVEKVDAPQDDTPWTDPVDRISPQAPEARLAKQIAEQIRQMVDHDTLPVEVDGTWHRRPITEGDILILVRRRGALFEGILRECKAAGLRVAGADRLRLGGELAVRDLKALLQFLALPEDDLALATVLRSPLFGWSEGDLFDLAHGRDGYLWAALRGREDHHTTRAILDDLRQQADFLRPFDLISRILVRHRGRENLLARLGDEAEEGIDAMLSQSLVYETGQIPSLTGFLVWLDAEDVEIKRQQGTGSAALRVMTVHGSKGLEAPIVILPDTAKRRSQDRGSVLCRDALAFWPPQAADMPDALSEMRSENRDREAQEANRLLYVAMTRAEQWLIVAAAGAVGEGQDSWYSMIADQMGPSSRDIPGLIRAEHGVWDGPLAVMPDQPEHPSYTPPPMDPVPTPPRRPSTLSPSDLGGAKAMPEDEFDPGQKDIAMARGTVLHTALEHLPRAPAAARAGLADRICRDHPDLAQTALRLVSAPHLSDLFAKGHAEVPITASLPELNGACIAGTVDLLIVDDQTVLAVDFKSNRVVPSAPDVVPVGILRQMGAYAAVLQQIWPNHAVKTAILWTQTETLMDLPHDLTRSALLDVTVP